MVEAILLGVLAGKLLLQRLLPAMKILPPLSALRLVRFLELAQLLSLSAQQHGTLVSLWAVAKYFEKTIQVL